MMRGVSLFVFGVLSAAPASAATCESLASEPFGPARGVVAELVAGAADLPEHCRVTATIPTSPDSSIRIEVRMPAAGWNEKFLVTGYAFFGSTMNPATMAGPLRDGYATATTDNGLPAGTRPQDASFLRGRPERVIDWGERAWHQTVVTAKAIVTAYYERPPAYSYFNGSGGAGRQGLKAVQRYPDDFDGVIVGGVAADSTHFSLANLWAWQAANRTEASRLSAEELGILHEAAVSACDALDGARDGLIGDPERCAFDPAVLQCRDGDAPTCLSEPQVQAVRQIYTPPAHSRTGRRLFGPLLPGSEPGWASFMTNPNGYAVEFFRSLVFEDPDWDPATLDWDRDVERAEAVHPAVNAVDPDISAFVARGGRLILWGGWADTAINPSAQTDYYTAVVEAIGDDPARRAVRLYMLPMMGHFLGGSGPHAYELDTRRLIEDWVERDVAPGAVVASHRANGTPDRTVLLCPYPQVAFYRGSGSTADAASFECRAAGSPVAGAQSQRDEARQLVEEAAAALGGRERLLAVRTLLVEGYGRNPNIGQAMTPEADPLLWMLPDYRRAIDLENNRMEVSFTRRPAFPAVFDNARAVQRLDDDVAMLHHPLTAVRAALQPGARLSNVRQNGAERSVDITTPDGDTVTLTVDSLNRPMSVRSAVYHQNLGDTERVTTFGAYENLDGIRLPKRFVTRLDRWVEFDIGVMKNTLDADLGGLEAASAPRAPQPPTPLNVTEVASGIWFVTGGGNPSLVVEFEDHVALVEVPGGDAGVQALIDTAAALVPGKPVTQAIVTHHHFDHTGGLRAAVARGLTIITHRVNEAWFRELVEQRTHAMNPDALSRSPRPLRLVTFDDSYTIRDPSMEMVLYHLANSTHGDGILSAWFPRERVYVEVDVWNPGARIQPHVRSLHDEIVRRGLDVDRIVPMHGNAVQPYAEFEKVVEEWSGRRVTPTGDIAP